MSKLPKNWISVTLGELALYVQRGKSPKYTHISDLPVINQKCIRWHGIEKEHVKYIHPEQYSAWGEERYLRDGDILWNSTGTGTIGRACIYKGSYFSKAVADSHVTIVRFAPNYLSPKYAFYFIASPYVQKKIEEMQSGSTNQVELGRSAIVETFMPLPPLNEQKRIVAKIEELFSELDKGIESLKTARQQLKIYRQAILKHAFEGKLTAEWRERNKDKLESGEQLLERIKRLMKNNKAFNKNETADLPPIPLEWQYTQLANVGDLGRGKSKHRPRNDKKLFGGQYPFIQTSEVKAASRIVRKYSQTYSDFGLEQSKLWPTGTLCITIAANIAETAFLGFDACFPDSVVGFTAQRDIILPEYVDFFIQSVRVKIEAYAPATAQKNINLTTLENIVIPICSKEEQKELIQQLEVIFSTIEINDAEIEKNLHKSEALRQSILKKAFSGQLVAQDPKDEPASVLLERIRAERERNKKVSKKVRAA